MQKTHVVMLLDESSSMGIHRQAVVDTFNQYTKELKAGKRMWLSLFKFAGAQAARFLGNQSNLRLEKVFENRKLKDTYPLTTPQYSPNGWTPLYDAIGQLIDRTKARLPKDAKVLFVIHTDGQENTSVKYTMESIKRKIAKCENKRGWTFVYLGEGAEAWNAGYDFGIDNVANFSSGMRGAAMGKLATATVSFSSADVGGQYGATRSFYADANLTPDDIDPDEQASYSSVVGNADQAAELKGFENLADDLAVTDINTPVVDPAADADYDALTPKDQS